MMKKRALLFLMIVCGIILECSSSRHNYSLESLGLPEPETKPEKNTIIVGWKKEYDKPWHVSSLYLNKNKLGSWDPNYQLPVVIYVTPGIYTLKLEAKYEDSEDNVTKIIRYQSPTTILNLKEKELIAVCEIALILKKDDYRPDFECVIKNREEYRGMVAYKNFRVEQELIPPFKEGEIEDPLEMKVKKLEDEIEQLKREIRKRE